MAEGSHGIITQEPIVMNEERILEMIEKVGSIAAAREPVDAIFTALRTFGMKTYQHNHRHLANPAPTPEEWKNIYMLVEPHAEELARVLAAHRDSFSLNLTIGLDGAAGLIDEAAAYGIDAPSILKQFSVQAAVGKIDRIPSKLNVFLYSWGRPSLEKYQGEEMKRAIEHASHIEREASYFDRYLTRLIERGIVNDESDGG